MPAPEKGLGFGGQAQMGENLANGGEMVLLAGGC